MFNLLIVDDEVILAEGLARDVDWSKSGISEVFVAESGEQACALLDEHRIDIVLTDILMPGMDGIALARTVRDRSSFARVIFLSGHDEFEYAQKAVDLAVFRYLMKPVGDDELTECVQQAAESISREMEEMVRLHDLEKRVVEYLPHVRGRFLRMWIERKRTDALDRTALLEQYGLNDLPECTVFVVLVRRDRWLVESRHRETVYELGIADLVNRILLRETDVPSFIDEHDDLVLVVRSRDSRNLHSLRTYVIRTAESLQSAARLSLGAIVSVAVGPAVRSERVPQTYRLLRDVARESHRGADGAVMDVASIPVCEPATSIEALTRPVGIGHFVDSLQETEAIGFLNETFNQIGRAGAVSKDALLAVYCRVVDALVAASVGRSIPVERWIDDPRHVRFSFERIRSIEELRAWCIRNVRRFIRWVLEHEELNPNLLVRRAKQIVLERLSDDVSVASIARELEIHPNYLSSLFSRAEGITLSEFITAHRIDAARRLLRLPGVKVYEVAERVGYQSVAHFNRTFKRRVGVSPKRYQLSD